MERLQVGDRVIISRGEDKGRTGKVLRIVKQKDAVVVEGVNRVKRHMRATPQRPGGILDVEAPIHVSKVQLVDPETGKGTRVRYETKDGKKVRVAVKSGKEIPVTRE